MHKASASLVIFFVAALLAGAHSQTTPALKDAFKHAFLIGAAINQAQFEERDVNGAALIKSQYNTVTPENVLKWESVHPRADGYSFEAPDHYVAFGEENHMVIIGHTLVWHNQTPKWVFEDAKGNPVGRDVLLARMRDHIHTVVGRYKGRIRGWDVVNEALNEDGAMRQTQWMNLIGEDYIAKAFQFAHEADPNAELYYNDYALENEAKRNGAIELIKKLKAQGVPVAAIGLQDHNKLDWPSAGQVDATIWAFAKLGLKVNITELDIDVLPAATQNRGADVTLKVELQAKLNPYASGLPDSIQQALARRYADLFAVFLKHQDVIDRVTFWGVADKDSWLNNWPVRGRTSYPLLFDRANKPKPAFDAVIQVAHPKQATAAQGPFPLYKKGRGQETYGEDPYLTSKLGVAFVRGLQGADPRYLKVIATPKHYAVHSGPAPERHGFDAKAIERDLRETYLPAFRATVVEARAASVMCAYNRTNTEPCCANKELMIDVLRREWGFDGYVVSDCGAVTDIWKGHHFAKSEAEASAMAVKAGTDLACGREYGALIEALKTGLIRERDIDLSLKQLMTALVLEKLVANTGGVKPSYLGPPESFHRGLRNG